MMDEFEEAPFRAGRAVAAGSGGEHAAAAFFQGKRTKAAVGHPNQRLSILTLGRFDIRRNGCSLLASGKLPRRPIALLLLLVAAGAQGCRRETLVERLWPSDDGADASRLKVALHRLRRLLGNQAFIISHADTLRINHEAVFVDAWELERLDGEGLEPEVLCRRALELYLGPFVADMASDPSLLIYQQHVEGRFDAAMVAGMRALAGTGQGDEALELALQGMMRMPSGGQLLPAAIELARRLGHASSLAALAALARAHDREARP